MKKANIITSIIFLALSATALIEASRLPIGSIRAPQMGFFPLILAIALTISSLFLIGQNLAEKKDEGKNPFILRSGSWKRIVLTVGALFAFVLFVGILGYRASTFLFIAFLLRVIEPQKWWLVITVALLSSELTHLVFVVFLMIPLPTGIFGF